MAGSWAETRMTRNPDELNAVTLVCFGAVVKLPLPLGAGGGPVGSMAQSDTVVRASAIKCWGPLGDGKGKE